MNDRLQLEERLKHLYWPVDRGGVWAGIEARAGKRKSRPRVRRARMMAVTFASLVLVAGAAYGAYRVVTHFQHPMLLLTDSTEPLATQPGDTGPSGPSPSDPEVQARVETMTNAPLELTAGGQTWIIDPPEIMTCLDYTSESVDGVSSLIPRLSPEKMGPILTALAGTLETPAIDATFDSDETKAWVVPGADGTAIDVEKTAEALTEAALRTTGRTAEIVFATKEPDLTTAEAEAMGIKDKLRDFTTEWTGTRDRQQNVALTTEYAGNVILAPGEEYDFDKQVGPRTPERGYQAPAGIVGPGVLVDVFGGALCQVSTTLFNAAFFAGLEIVERHNNSIFIDHYPTGLDAAITEDGNNLRFRNNTDHYLWIRGESDGITTSFNIYGTDDGRKVTYTTSDFYDVVPRTEVTVPVADLPEGTTSVGQGGQSGKTCDVVRTITWADGSTTTDTFVSVWPMVPQEIQVGTGTSTTATP
jgi:vancomycin resistance protein YoaR